MAEVSHSEALLAADAESRAEVLGRILAAERPRLVRMVAVRMHPRVRARIDPSDVIQDACVEISRSVDAYVQDPRMPFFLWMRRIVGQRLMKAHRFHLDAKRRDVRQEQRAERQRPDVSTVAIADMLRHDGPSPLSEVLRDEAQARLVGRLEQLSETDREIISLRHFEALSNEEVAAELGLGKHAASKRYIRAIQRLKELVDADEPPQAGAEES